MSEKSTFVKTEAQRKYNQEWRKRNKEKVKNYNKEYRAKNPHIIKRLEHNRNTQRVRFQGPQIDLGYNPRIGVCNKCRYVGQTHLHHEKYDESNPLKHTIELCISCHNKERRHG